MKAVQSVPPVGVAMELVADDPGRRVVVHHITISHERDYVEVRCDYCGKSWGSDVWGSAEAHRVAGLHALMPEASTETILSLLDPGATFAPSPELPPAETGRQHDERGA